MANNPINMVFDSDVVIHLSEMHYLKMNGLTFYDLDPNSALRAFYNLYETVYGAVERGRLDLLL